MGDWDLVKGLSWSAHTPEMEDHDGIIETKIQTKILN